jgi:hypothetical protein
MLDIRPSPIAGQWYPGDPKRLTATVDAYLAAAPAPEVPGELVGVVAPHAGHLYSGAVAAYAFKAAQPLDVETVVITCPSHRHDDGPLITTRHEAYTTPLGVAPVDGEALAQVAKTCPVPLTPIRRDQEHAIEIELPFLQRLFANFKLIPIMIRDQTWPVVSALAKALVETLRDRRVLYVASSDLSHFYPQAAAKKLDAYLLSKIDAFDPEGVLRAEEEGKGFACGKGAIATTLLIAKALGATEARVIKHATSGDVTGDYDQVVGYGAAVIWK